MAKNVFTSEAKILGVKLKTGPERSYERPPGNKLEIAFEVELPWSIPINSYKQWQDDYRDGPPSQLLRRLTTLDNQLKNRAAPKSGAGKKAGKNAAPNSDVELELQRRELLKELQAAYEKYQARVKRHNERAAAAANHAGLYMALGGQLVRLTLSPIQRGFDGMLALPMPEAIEDPDASDDRDDIEADDRNEYDDDGGDGDEA